MWLTAILVVAATVYRLLPHPWNVAPMGALFLLSGLYMPRRNGLVWAFPFAAAILSDIAVYYQYDGSIFRAGRLIDYAALALIAALGLWARNRSIAARAGTVVATPFIFYIVSNFGVWIGADAVMYPHTFAGLVECYVKAIPFFRGTFAGDVLFAGGGILLIESLRHSHGIWQRLSQPATT